MSAKTGHQRERAACFYFTRFAIKHLQNYPITASTTHEQNSTSNHSRNIFWVLSFGQHHSCEFQSCSIFLKASSHTAGIYLFASALFKQHGTRTRIVHPFSKYSRENSRSSNEYEFAQVINFCFGRINNPDRFRVLMGKGYRSYW